MIPIGQPIPPGYCTHCRVECRDCSGSELWPHRPDLADVVVWMCPTCDARVGSHAQTGQPLGTAANAELRRAREMLHGRLDPIWTRAYLDPAYAVPRETVETEADKRKRLAIIKRTARSRVYAFLAAQMELSKDACHVAMFDLVACRQAWVALGGVSYGDVRKWAHEKRAALGDEGKPPKQKRGKAS